MNEYMKRRMQQILEGRPLKTKERKPIAKISENRKKKLQELSVSKDNKLDKWFEDRRKEMTGKCFLCGMKTQKHDDTTYRHSIHHIFEKRPSMFPSVSTHPDNFLEVCFYGTSCHTNLHNGTITWELLLDSAEGKTILEKVRKVLPFIAESERKNIPDILLKYL